VSDHPENTSPAPAAKVGRVLLASLVVAVVAEQAIHGNVFQGTPPGLGLVIALLAPVALLAASPIVAGRRPSAVSAALLAGAAFFIAMLAVRDSGELVALNVVTSVVLVSLAAHLHPSGGLGQLTLTDLARVGLSAPISVTVVQPALFTAQELGPWLKAKRSSGLRARRLLRGLALAVIPLVVFGVLLASADAVFAGLLDDLFGFDFDATVVPATLLVLLFTWVGVGLVHYSRSHEPLRPVTRPMGYLGKTETITLLSPLCLLFLAFVVIQFAYLFGGADTIAATGGLTRAEYARQGFFQLVAVAALVITLLLVVDWAHRPAQGRPDRVVGVLSAVLIALTGVMVASAVKRMTLYVDAFGLTQLRLYTTAFTVWVAVLLLLFLATAWRGRRRAFATGALVAAVLVVAGLDLANPDALIAGINLDRHLATGAELDTDYLVAHLSDDATPTIAGRLAALPDQCTAARLFEGLRHEGRDLSGGWRSWQWARGHAADVLEGLAGQYPAGCAGQ